MQNLTLVFDLDGTLIDTAPDLIRATNHVLATLDLSPVAPQTLRPKISFGALRMIETGLAAHGFERSEEQLYELFDIFLKFYSKHIAVESRPFDGIADILSLFAGRGTRLCVCTNKREDLSRALLHALELEEIFDVIAGRDTFDVFKPHPDHLNRTIALAGGNKDRTIMVGDSQTDISTANAANIPIIGVTFGYSDPPMQQLHPTIQIESYAEFENAVASLL